MELCPKCHRKLLSHASANCNWCGCKIDDPEYQQAADQSREAFFYRDRLEQAAEIARVDIIQAMPMGPYSAWPRYSTPPFAGQVFFPPRRQPTGAVAPPANDTPAADSDPLDGDPRGLAEHIELQ